MIKQLLQEGFILKSKGYYKHAIEAFYKALELDNKSSELLFEIADSYYLMNDEERAINYIEQILETNPKHVESLKLLKRIFLNKKAFNEATKTAANIYAITQSSNDLIEILKLLNMQKRYKEVLEYDLLIDESEILYEKAYAGLFSNEIKLAEEYINLALEKEPKNSGFLLLKGKILFKKGLEDACAEILNLMVIDETNPDMLNFAGLVEQQQGNYKSALKYFLLAISQSSNTDEYYYNCASTYFKMGDTTLAKKYYNLAISMNPENPSYHLALANLYYSDKQFRRALEELNFDFYEANLLKSIILYDSGYFAMAKKGFLMLKNERTKDFVVDEYLAKIQDKLKI